MSNDIQKIKQISLTPELTKINNPNNEKDISTNIEELILDTIEDLFPQNNILSNYGGIYDIDNIDIAEFGGDQGELYAKREEFLNNKDAIKIIEKYFGKDFTEEDMELLFYRMNSVGCGYVAATNTLMEYARTIGLIEFSEKFGYNSFNIGGPNLTDWNTELVFLDFFLYYNTKYKGFTTIEDVYGNVIEEIEFKNNKAGDDALAEEKFFKIGAEGTYTAEIAEVLKQFLSEKGINLDLSDKFALTPGSEAWTAKLNSLNSSIIDLNVGIDTILYEKEINPNVAKEILKEGKQIVISSEGFDYYSTKDIDNNGLLDDICYEDVGPHAFTIVGVTEDNRYIVSSWGKDFIFDPKIDKINNFVIYDYSNN